MAAWLRSDRGCSVIFGQQGLGCLGCWHVFVTLAIHARVFCRYNWCYKMVPLAVIGGACFWVIVTKGGELFLFYLEDELSLVISEAMVRLVVESIFVVQCWFFVLYGNCFVGKYHPLDQN